MTEKDSKPDPRSRHFLVSIGQKAGEPGRGSKYDPANCERVIFWASDGEFIEQWAARLDVSIGTVYAWTNRYPEFAEAVRIAYAKSADFWMRVGVSNLANTNFKHTVYLEIMRKRFPALWAPDPVQPAVLDPLKDDGDRDTPASVTIEEGRRMTDADLRTAIEQYERRRKHDGSRDK